jgi:hypothetical protein
MLVAVQVASQLAVEDKSGLAGRPAAVQRSTGPLQNRSGSAAR